MSDAVPLPRIIAIEEFLPLVSQRLQAACDPEPVLLDLVSATPLVNHARLARPPFLLIFRSAPDALLVEGSYVMRAPGFGPDQVYIAPIAPPADAAPGRYYQSVMN